MRIFVKPISPHFLLFDHPENCAVYFVEIILKWLNNTDSYKQIYYKISKIFSIRTL